VALGSGPNHSPRIVTTVDRSWALLVVPPAAACATWIVLASIESIILAISPQATPLDSGLRVFAAAAIVALLSAGAFSFHLLFILPITWPLRQRSVGLGSVVGRLVAPALGAATVFAAFYFDAHVDRVVDVLWTASVVIALPVVLMTVTAARLQASFRPLPNEC
jgi:hypothetical protein